MTEPLNPAPGSPSAVQQGCLCPIYDNSHGKGYYGQPGVYVMRTDCPLHGEEADRDD